MDWRQMVGDKLMSPQESIGAVQSGDQVMVAPISMPHPTPFARSYTTADKSYGACEWTIRRPFSLGFNPVKRAHSSHGTSTPPLQR